MSEIRTLYDEDFFLWSKTQAEALRAAARGTTNLPIDWENVAEEIWRGELTPREVHRDDAAVHADATPVVQLTAGLVQHPGAEGTDETGVFGDGDEGVGTHDAVVRPPPAHEGFDADQGAPIDGDEWLIHDVELVKRDRTP